MANFFTNYPLSIVFTVFIIIISYFFFFDTSLGFISLILSFLVSFLISYFVLDKFNYSKISFIRALQKIVLLNICWIIVGLGFITICSLFYI